MASSLEARLAALERSTTAATALCGLGAAYALWEAAATVGGVQALRTRMDCNGLTPDDEAVFDALRAHTDSPRDLVRRVAESEDLFYPVGGDQ